MTEISYFHNGAARGDAYIAPYADAIFHSIMQGLYNSDGVIYDADYLTALAVTATGVDMIVTVAAGSAFIQGVYFDNSGAEAFTLDVGPTSGFRYDRIVVRVDWAAHTARLAVIKGAAGVSPDLPTLQQDFGEIWEFPIARIYIPEATTVTSQVSVHDERMFLPSAQTPPIKNIMHNSEFIANADTSFDGEAPAYWWSTGGFPIESSAVGSELQARGRAIQAVIQNGDTLETDLYACDLSTTYYPDETLVTIAFYIQVAEGGVVTLDFDGGAGGSVYVVYSSAKPLLYLYRCNVSSTFDTIGFFIEAFRETTFDLYQVTVAFGPNPAPFLPNKETILFGTKVAATGSPFTRSTGAYTLARSLLPVADSIYEGNLYFLQRVYDSGSAGADSIYAAMGDANNIRTEVGRLANSVHRQHIGQTQGGDTNDATPSVPIDVVASGAGLLTQEIYVIGCET